MQMIQHSIQPIYLDGVSCIAHLYDKVGWECKKTNAK